MKQASIDSITKTVSDYLNRETSETCNQYISTLQKPKCTVAHKNLYGLLVSKAIEVEPIADEAQKERMDAVKQAAWYFISDPYKAENLEKEVEDNDKAKAAALIRPPIGSPPIGKPPLVGAPKPIMELSTKGKGYLEEFIKAKNLDVKWEEPKKAAAEEKPKEGSEEKPQGDTEKKPKEDKAKGAEKKK